MSKKETSSFIFEGEKIKCDFFDEDNEEDKIEIKKLHNILTNSPSKIEEEEEEDDNKDLNNITSVSETDKVYLGEVKDATKKSQESEYEIENELNETSLTNKNLDEEEEKEKNQKVLDDNIENNDLIKNENKNRNNLNIQNNILNELKEEDVNHKNNIQGKRYKNNSRNKSPIFLIRKIKKRSKKIQLLRKKKGLHIIRKKDSDTIRKKVKTYFHNYLLDLLNTKVKKLNIKNNINLFDDINMISGPKLKLKKVNKYLKFNNKFTTNVSINVNKNLLLKKLSLILMNEPISSKYKAYDLKNNYYLTKYLLSLKTVSDIHRLLNLTYMELYNEFLKSTNFQNILKKIKNRDGDIYMNKFKNVSNNYISYFNNTKSKKEPKCEINKKIFYKDKNKEKKENNKSKKKKTEYINNSFDNELSNYKFKNTPEIFNISHVNNNMSLVEDFHELFRNQSSQEERNIKEIDYEYNNIHSKIIKHFEFINNFTDENNCMKKYYENNCNYSLEKEQKIFLNENNENNFWTEKNIEISFVNNNLSEIIEDNFDEKKNIFEEDNSIIITKKRTSDYSKTNESDYNSMKFIDSTNKNNINNKIIFEGFKEFI
jgi:hypothetical protein